MAHNVIDMLDSPANSLHRPYDKWVVFNGTSLITVKCHSCQLYLTLPTDYRGTCYSERQYSWYRTDTLE